MMLEERPVICLHCGQSELKIEGASETSSMGFDRVQYVEKRVVYRCQACHQLSEYYWMWGSGGKCIIEETVKIEWRENPYFNPDGDSAMSQERYYEHRESKRVDLRVYKPE